MTNTKTAAARKAPAAAQNPLFYNKPIVLDGAKHADWGVNKDATLSFAAEANALPINLVEFPQIAHFYPIAFASDAVATPVAIVCIRNDENLFVDKKGVWQANTYVPAYIRRYPFILSEMPGGKQLSLCVEDSPAVLMKKAPAANRFFDDKKQPTPLAKNAMEFCRSYHAAAKQTATFGEALVAAGLLVNRSADIKLKDGQRLGFSGFRVIDEAKFNALPAETIMEWRKKGWLAAVYAHLFSSLHWTTVTRMLNERIPDPSPAKKSKGKK